jgi:hypothetical protein
MRRTQAQPNSRNFLSVVFHCTYSSIRRPEPSAYTFTAQDGGSHTFGAVFHSRGRKQLTAADDSSDGLRETEIIRITD